ncbi:conserved Plasmodium protein, unknown function [Plasmodium ovale curtisi]|uniref:Uncharacterized protein n=1 Tax=Plasmodium ovale curtisi TaxID=864141 RepID=A0A1A8X0I3_PLAOA|nr:conserved Plasmodium protein, unknown function [Plasmodium ovale curtisi]
MEEHNNGNKKYSLLYKERNNEKKKTFFSEDTKAFCQKLNDSNCSYSFKFKPPSKNLLQNELNRNRTELKVKNDGVGHQNFLTSTENNIYIDKKVSDNNVNNFKQNNVIYNQKDGKEKTTNSSSNGFLSLEECYPENLYPNSLHPCRNYTHLNGKREHVSSNEKKEIEKLNEHEMSNILTCRDLPSGNTYENKKRSLYSPTKTKWESNDCYTNGNIENIHPMERNEYSYADHFLENFGDKLAQEFDPDIHGKIDEELAQTLAEELDEELAEKLADELAEQLAQDFAEENCVSEKELAGLLEITKGSHKNSRFSFNTGSTSKYGRKDSDKKTFEYRNAFKNRENPIRMPKWGIFPSKNGEVNFSNFNDLGTSSDLKCSDNFKSDSRVWDLDEEVDANRGIKLDEHYGMGEVDSCSRRNCMEEMGLFDGQNDMEEENLLDGQNDMKEENPFGEQNNWGVRNSVKKVRSFNDIPSILNICSPSDIKRGDIRNNFDGSNEVENTIIINDNSDQYIEEPHIIIKKEVTSLGNFLKRNVNVEKEKDTSYTTSQKCSSYKRGEEVEAKKGTILKIGDNEKLYLKRVEIKTQGEVNKKPEERRICFSTNNNLSVDLKKLNCAYPEEDTLKEMRKDKREQLNEEYTERDTNMIEQTEIQNMYYAQNIAHFENKIIPSCINVESAYHSAHLVEANTKDHNYKEHISPGISENMRESSSGKIFNSFPISMDGKSQAHVNWKDGNLESKNSPPGHFIIRKIIMADDFPQEQEKQCDKDNGISYATVVNGDTRGIPHMKENPNKADNSEEKRKSNDIIMSMSAHLPCFGSPNSTSNICKEKKKKNTVTLKFAQEGKLKNYFLNKVKLEDSKNSKRNMKLHNMGTPEKQSQNTGMPCYERRKDFPERINIKLTGNHLGDGKTNTSIISDALKLIDKNTTDENYYEELKKIQHSKRQGNGENSFVSSIGGINEKYTKKNINMYRKCNKVGIKKSENARLVKIKSPFISKQNNIPIYIEPIKNETMNSAKRLKMGRQNKCYLQVQNSHLNRLDRYISERKSKANEGSFLPNKAKDEEMTSPVRFEAGLEAVTRLKSMARLSPPPGFEAKQVTGGEHHMIRFGSRGYDTVEEVEEKEGKNKFFNIPSCHSSSSYDLPESSTNHVHGPPKHGILGLDGKQDLHKKKGILSQKGILPQKDVIPQKGIHHQKGVIPQKGIHHQDIVSREKGEIRHALVPYSKNCQLNELNMKKEVNEKKNSLSKKKNLLLYETLSGSKYEMNREEKKKKNSMINVKADIGKKKRKEKYPLDITASFKCKNIYLKINVDINNEDLIKHTQYKFSKRNLEFKLITTKLIDGFIKSTESKIHKSSNIILQNTETDISYNITIHAYSNVMPTIWMCASISFYLTKFSIEKFKLKTPSSLSFSKDNQFQNLLLNKSNVEKNIPKILSKGGPKGIPKGGFKGCTKGILKDIPKILSKGNKFETQKRPSNSPIEKKKRFSSTFQIPLVERNKNGNIKEEGDKKCGHPQTDTYNILDTDISDEDDVVIKKVNICDSLEKIGEVNESHSNVRGSEWESGRERCRDKGMDSDRDGFTRGRMDTSKKLCDAIHGDSGASSSTYEEILLNFHELNKSKIKNEFEVKYEKSENKENCKKVETIFNANTSKRQSPFVKSSSCTKYNNDNKQCNEGNKETNGKNYLSGRNKQKKEEIKQSFNLSDKLKKAYKDNFRFSNFLLVKNNKCQDLNKMTSNHLMGKDISNTGSFTIPNGQAYKEKYMKNMKKEKLKKDKQLEIEKSNYSGNILIRTLYEICDNGNDNDSDIPSGSPLSGKYTTNWGDNIHTLNKEREKLKRRRSTHDDGDDDDDDDNDGDGDDDDDDDDDNDDDDRDNEHNMRRMINTNNTPEGKLKIQQLPINENHHTFGDFFHNNDDVYKDKMKNHSANVCYVNTHEEEKKTKQNYTNDSFGDSFTKIPFVDKYNQGYSLNSGFYLSKDGIVLSKNGRNCTSNFGSMEEDDSSTYEVANEESFLPIGENNKEETTFREEEQIENRSTLIHTFRCHEKMDQGKENKEEDMKISKYIPINNNNMNGKMGITGGDHNEIHEKKYSYNENNKCIEPTYNYIDDINSLNYQYTRKSSDNNIIEEKKENIPKSPSNSSAIWIHKYKESENNDLTHQNSLSRFKISNERNNATSYSVDEKLINLKNKKIPSVTTNGGETKDKKTDTHKSWFNRACERLNLTNKISFLSRTNPTISFLNRTIMGGSEEYNGHNGKHNLHKERDKIYNSEDLLNKRGNFKNVECAHNAGEVTSSYEHSGSNRVVNEKRTESFGYHGQFKNMQSNRLLAPLGSIDPLYNSEKAIESRKEEPVIKLSNYKTNNGTDAQYAYGNALSKQHQLVYTPINMGKQNRKDETIMNCSYKPTKGGNTDNYGKSYDQEMKCSKGNNHIGGRGSNIGTGMFNNHKRLANDMSSNMINGNVVRNHWVGGHPHFNNVHVNNPHNSSGRYEDHGSLANNQNYFNMRTNGRMVNEGISGDGSGNSSSGRGGVMYRLNNGIIASPLVNNQNVHNNVLFRHCAQQGLPNCDMNGRNKFCTLRNNVYMQNGSRENIINMFCHNPNDELNNRNEYLNGNAMKYNQTVRNTNKEGNIENIKLKPNVYNTSTYMDKKGLVKNCVLTKGCLQKNMYPPVQENNHLMEENEKDILHMNGGLTHFQNDKFHFGEHVKKGTSKKNATFMPNVYNKHKFIVNQKGMNGVKPPGMLYGGHLTHADTNARYLKHYCPGDSTNNMGGTAKSTMGKFHNNDMFNNLRETNRNPNYTNYNMVENANTIKLNAEFGAYTPKYVYSYGSGLNGVYQSKVHPTNAILSRDIKVLHGKELPLGGCANERDVAIMKSSLCDGNTITKDILYDTKYSLIDVSKGNNNVRNNEDKKRDDGDENRDNMNIPPDNANNHHANFAKINYTSQNRKCNQNNGTFFLGRDNDDFSFRNMETKIDYEEKKQNSKEKPTNMCKHDNDVDITTECTYTDNVFAHSESTFNKSRKFSPCFGKPNDASNFKNEESEEDNSQHGNTQDRCAKAEPFQLNIQIGDTSWIHTIFTSEDILEDKVKQLISDNGLKKKFLYPLTEKAKYMVQNNILKWNMNITELL